MIDRIVSYITPVNEYIKNNHISDTSVIWDLLIKVDSFKILKGKRNQKGNNSKKDTKSPYRNKSPSPSYTPTILFKNPPISTNVKTYFPPSMTTLSLPQNQHESTAPPPLTTRPLEVSPVMLTEDKTPTPEVITTKEKSLIEHGYSDMKNNAMQDMEMTKMIIQGATEKK